MPTVVGFPLLHSLPFIARIVPPKPCPEVITECTLFIQNHRAVLNEMTGSVATVSGALSPSNPMLCPAGP